MIYNFKNGYTTIKIENNILISIFEGDFRAGGETFNRCDSSQDKHTTIDRILKEYKSEMTDDVIAILKEEYARYKEYYDKNKDIIYLHNELDTFVKCIETHNRATFPPTKKTFKEKAIEELEIFTKSNLI